MTDKTAKAPPEVPAARRPPWVLAADFVGSLWFGIAMMTLILLYCWVGSAGTQPFYDWFPRQSFEMTEMEWFNSWPFSLLIALLSVSLIIATLRKVRLNLPNLGVWLVHTGILVLVLGTAVYYITKLEGDMLVYRRQAQVSVDGGVPLGLVLRPGEQGVVRGADRAFRVRVASLNPRYELLTGEDKGKTAYSAQLHFEPMPAGAGEPFIRQLLVGYPQYTEDVIPGKGRAIKSIGRKLVDEGVSVDLDYKPSDTFYLRDRPALYARFVGEEDWTEYPIGRLPRYRGYVAAEGDAIVPAGERPPRADRLSIELEPEGHEPSPVELSVRGYLPYAHLRNHWVPGGDHFQPFARVHIRMGTAELTEVLLAGDPRNSHLTVPNTPLHVSFRWLRRPAELDRLLAPGTPRLRVSVEGAPAQEVPLQLAASGPVEIAGTRYRVQLKQVYDQWALANSRETAQMAVVQVDDGSRSFLRAVVAPQVELSQDLGESGHMAGGLLDEKVKIELLDLRPSGLVVVGGAAGLHLLLVREDGTVETHSPEVGEPVDVAGGMMRVSVDQLSATAHRVLAPELIPLAERDVKAGSFYSQVQVDVRQGAKAERVWVEYSDYPHRSRAGFFPRRVVLGDGRQLELVFSRERVRLSRPVVLEDFQLEVFPGGSRERDYISRVRFAEGGDWSELAEVRSNQPVERDGWWFFQATWDPPAPERGYAGMNYTGLGVGNRHGVGVMLAGSILTVFGTIWAFYLKPVLLLRRRRRLAAGRRVASDPEAATAPAEAARETVLAAEGGE